MQEQHVKLHFAPQIMFTSQQAAHELGISLEKADQLLSSPDTYEIVKAALTQGIQETLVRTLQQMVRQRWPQDTIPVRVDCVVKLPSLSITGDLGQ